MNIINDPNQLRHRIALQFERDYEADNVAFLLEDLRLKMQRRLAANQPILSTEEKRYLGKKIRMLCDDHLELVFGENWTNQNRAIRQTIYKQVTDSLIGITLVYDVSADDYLRIYGPVIIEGLFKDLMAEIKVKYQAPSGNVYLPPISTAPGSNPPPSPPSPNVLPAPNTPKK